MNKQEKKLSVGLVLCFVAMIAIVGMITFSQYGRNAENKQLAEAGFDKEEETEQTQTTNTEHIQAEVEKAEVQIVPAPIEPSRELVSESLSFSSSDLYSFKPSLQV